MTLIVNVEQGQEDFLLKLLRSLNIVTNIEQVEDKPLTIPKEHATIIKSRLAKYQSGEMNTKSWEELQKELNDKHGL